MLETEGSEKAKFVNVTVNLRLNFFSLFSFSFFFRAVAEVLEGVMIRIHIRDRALFIRLSYFCACALLKAGKPEVYLIFFIYFFS